MARLRLPDRRPNDTRTLEFGSMRFAVTVGFYRDGRPGEIFTSGARTGCDLDYLLDDACVALSLLLQHGVDPRRLTASMGRAGDGRTPASLIGALTDWLAEVAGAEELAGSPTEADTAMTAAVGAAFDTNRSVEVRS